jgi:hypothetical protein
MGLDENLRERADFYRQHTEHMDVALYSAAVDENKTDSLPDEFLEPSDEQVDEFEEVRENILGPSGAHRHIAKAASELDYDEPASVARYAHKLINDATNFHEDSYIADESKEDFTAKSAAAGAIYMAGLVRNDKVPMEEVGNALNKSEGTIRKTYHEMCERVNPVGNFEENFI